MDDIIIVSYTMTSTKPLKTAWYEGYRLRSYYIIVQKGLTMYITLRYFNPFDVLLCFVFIYVYNNVFEIVIIRLSIMSCVELNSNISNTFRHGTANWEKSASFSGLFRAICIRKHTQVTVTYTFVLRWYLYYAFTIFIFIL